MTSSVDQPTVLGRAVVVAGGLAPWLLPLVLLACSDVGSPARGGEARAGERAATEATEQARVERLRLEIVAEYPHDRRAYTQGLLVHEGEIFESTGRNGTSGVRRYLLEDGEVLARNDLERRFFGEGISVVEDRLIMLTWQAGVAFVFSIPDLAVVRRHSFSGEGWGLAYDGEQLIQSDGTHVLTLRDPESFQQIDRVKVRQQGRPRSGLNELEWVHGELWANVYQTDEILRIDPSTGAVTGVLDASGLLDPRERAGADVLNGIAYLPESGTFLLTGKYWPKTFEVRIVPDE